MMIGYLFIRIDSYHSLITNNVNMNVVTPIFIYVIGEYGEKNESDIENLSKQYPDAEFHIDDIR